MTNQPYGKAAPHVKVKSSRLEPLINTCYRPALEQLGQAYARRCPAAILISDGRVGPSLVIDSFLAGLAEDVTVTRIPGPFSDATACMRQIVQDVGIEPRQMTLGDLESVLEMFLVYQRNKKQRTIICCENSQSSDWWVLDKIRRLIELEAQEKYGLMVIQSGSPNGNSELDEPILNMNGQHGIQRIVLSPFSLSETRDFVRRRVEAPDTDQIRIEDVSQVFEFFAVTLIHEFSAGVPEYVEKLCDGCLRLMNDAGDSKVSTDIVISAARFLGLESTTHETNPDMATNSGDREATSPGRLIVQSKDNDDSDDREILLDQNCIMIGRDRLCGIRITGLRVSRYHAFIAISSHGLQFVDLGSTNGSVVNGRRANRCEIKDNDVISIGHTRITYVAGGEQLTFTGEIDRTDSYEICDQPAGPSITHVGQDVQLLRT